MLTNLTNSVYLSTVLLQIKLRLSKETFLARCIGFAINITCWAILGLFRLFSAWLYAVISFWGLDLNQNPLVLVGSAVSIVPHLNWHKQFCLFFKTLSCTLFTHRFDCKKLTNFLLNRTSTYLEGSDFLCFCKKVSRFNFVSNCC